MRTGGQNQASENAPVQNRNQPAKTNRTESGADRLTKTVTSMPIVAAPLKIAALIPPARRETFNAAGSRRRSVPSAMESACGAVSQIIIIDVCV